ncbi:MAG: hypothetical protein WAX66_01115 [Patescibacteria group bacterium]
MTKEEIKKKLEEDQSYTLPDDATDEEWDTYLEVKNEKSGNIEEEKEEDDEFDQPDEEEEIEEEL